MVLKIDVKGNIRIKRRIVVNGREYSSVEEMPEDIRRAYELAVATAGRETHATDPVGRPARIVFNGQEYGDVDEMPEDIRQLYRAAILALEARGKVDVGAAGTREQPPVPEGSSRAPLPSMAPIEVGGGPVSPFVRLAIAGIVILMLLGALYYLLHLPR
jgi:hypothetical protein